MDRWTGRDLVPSTFSSVGLKRRSGSNRTNGTLLCSSLPGAAPTPQFTNIQMETGGEFPRAFVGGEETDAFVCERPLTRAGSSSPPGSAEEAARTHLKVVPRGATSLAGTELVRAGVNIVRRRPSHTRS